MILRPGVQALLEDARRGAFETVVALDRISRDQADVATLYKHLRFAGVTIFTLAAGEGEINELHVGLKGTMNALFLKDLAAKTHRGLRGRVEAGKSGGGICYGYDVVKLHDEAGERIRGEREINEAEAEIVRRIFREFAAGASPRAIARRLNDEGIPGAKGRLWSDSVLRGHARRGTGLLNNELYIGRLVWNRQRFLKNPDTGKRVARVNPPEEWIIAEVPELRIVDDALWQDAKTRQGELAEKYAIAATRNAHANPMNAAHRPRYLLSGLLECGVCGGPYSMRGQGRYGCSNHVMTGSCANSHPARRDRGAGAGGAEGQADGARGRRRSDESVCRGDQPAQPRASGASDRAELAGIEKKIASMLDAIEEGGYVRGMSDRLRELEARQDEINERLSAAPVDIPDVHPNIAGVYRRKVERLAEALADPRDQAAEAIRGLIERIVLTPGAKHGELHAALHGDLGTILEWAGSGRAKGATDILRGRMSVSVVAGAGFEPATFRL